MKTKIFRKRIFSAVLSVLLCLSWLTACGSTEEKPTGESSEATQAVTVSEEERLYGDLPTGKYGGYEFNVLQYKETTAATATVLTEQSDAPIEQAIYERGVVVEERLGVEFINHLDDLDKTVTLLKNSIAGGLDEYDVYWAHSTTTITNFLAAGSLLPLDSLEALQFEKPWWDATANEYLTIGDHPYMAFGDINIYLYDFHSTLVFNKDITDQYREDLYAMVANGTWTMEEFIRLATDTALPAADGGKTYDRMGYTGHSHATMFGFLHGTGVELIVRDENNLPVMESVSETYVDVLTTYNTLFKDTALCNVQDLEHMATFAAERATFVSCGVGQLGALREEEFHYGLLPFPKRTVDQKDYISFVSNQIQPMVIPKTASNTERTGVVLENLAAESYRTVRPEYFQILLESKYVRDPESLDILDRIFAGETRFEMEHIYGWGGFENNVIEALTGKADRFVSTVEKRGTLVRKGIEETLEYLAVTE